MAALLTDPVLWLGIAIGLGAGFAVDTILTRWRARRDTDTNGAG